MYIKHTTGSTYIVLPGRQIVLVYADLFRLDYETSSCKHILIALDTSLQESQGHDIIEQHVHKMALLEGTHKPFHPPPPPFGMKTI